MRLEVLSVGPAIHSAPQACRKRRRSQRQPAGFFLQTANPDPSAASRYRRVPFASGVRAMLIIVMLEIEQLRLQVGRGPEKRAVQAFSA
jgi:hypothetical protein